MVCISGAPTGFLKVGWIMRTRETSPVGQRKLRPLEWAAGSLVLAGVGAITVTFFTVEVCDQQLTSTGGVTTVCRHLQATDPPVIVVGILILAFLGVFFSEISGFGFTLKRSVEEAKRTAHYAAREARQASEDVRETAGDLGEGLRAALNKSQPTDEAVSAGRIDPVQKLAARYNEIRWTMPSGAERTAAMTALTQEMIDLLREADDFDLESNLRSDDRGLRLAAFAFLYANPDPDWADKLAEVAVSEDKPFNEYWALRALDMVLEGHCEALSPATRERLRQRRHELAPEVDRAKQIDRLLRKCP
jgi:hypothetical protein